MQSVLRQTYVVLEMIKFQHTVFALPFAITAALIAANGLPDTATIFWIIAACIFARTAAMSFNRWADRELDKRNPRTAMRALPAGHLQAGFVLLFTVISIAGFIASAAMLNWLALAFTPVALLILLGYSYAKRLTSLAHFVLGTALALAPVGAWIAVRGAIELPAVLLGFGVLAWTAGFDLIYACQDVEVDRHEQLHSIPARFGPTFAITLSRALHVISVMFFVWSGISAEMGIYYFAGVGVAVALLLAEHLVVNPSDMKRINLAFFTINSWVGAAILAGTIVDLVVTR